MLRLSALSGSDIQHWSRLLDDADPGARAFLSPEFCFSVEEGQGQVFLLQVLQGDEIISAIPVQKDIGAAGVLGGYRQVGLEISDHFQVLGSAELVMNVRPILARAKVSSLYVTHVPESEERKGLEIGHKTNGYRLRLESDTSDLATESRRRSPRYWSDAERCRRKIEREIGPLEFEWFSANSEKFKWLIDRKLEQYTRTGSLSSALFDPSVQKILRLLHGVDSPRFKGVLSVLSAGDELLAMHFGIQTPGHLHYWFPAYDTAFSKYSPGKVLLTCIISEASSHSLKSVDFGEGRADYKEALANDTYELGKALVYNGFQGVLSTLPRRLRWFMASRKVEGVPA